MEKNNLILSNESYSIEKSDKTQEKDYTLIEIGDKKYALETIEVQEIMKVVELAYPNEMPPCILGILKYLNTPISIIDLRNIFKKERTVYNINSKIIITKTPNSFYGFMCDDVIDIKRLNPKNIHDLPYQKQDDFYKGLYIENSETIYILNVDNIKKYVDNYRGELQEEKEARKFIVSDDASKEILKERKESLYKYNDLEPTLDPSLYDRGVSFSINDVKYYINLASIKEFYRLNHPKLIRVPNCPNYIMGLINIKGEYICVLDIRRFYMTSKTTLKEKSTLIILNSNEYKIGILADEILENMNINFEEIIQNKIQKQDDDKMLEFVKNDTLYQVIDTEKLFSDKRLTIC